MIRLSQRVRARQPSGTPKLSPLAKRVGITHAFSFAGNGGGVVVRVPNLGTNIDQESGLVFQAGTANFAAGPGGIGAQSTSSAQFTVVNNPFATSTCTYIWVESGVDVTANGQTLTYEAIGGGEENNGIQIRLVKADIQIIASGVAIELTGTGARNNDGTVNVCAASIAGDNGRHAIFANGRLVASATPTITYTHGTGSTFGGGPGVPFDTIIPYALFFAPVAIPDAVLQDLTRNPWKLFADQGRHLDIAAPVGVSVALTGVAGTGSVGTVAPSLVVPITGNAATGAVGTVSPSQAGSAALTGVAATGAVGTVSAAKAVALTGNAATGSAGTVSTAAVVALTGIAATGSVGTVAPSLALPMTGNAATGSVGTVSASQAGSAALAGVAAAGSAGTVVPSTVVPVTGNAATGAVGSVTASQASSAALTGAAASGVPGTVAPATVVALTGNAATGSVGSVTVAATNVTVALTGVTAIGAVGSVGAPNTKNRGGGGGEGDKKKKKRKHDENEYELKTVFTPLPPVKLVLPEEEEVAEVVAKAVSPKAEAKAESVIEEWDEDEDEIFLLMHA